MSILQMALVLVVVIFLGVWLWLRQRDQSSGKPSQPSDRVDTLTGWPPQATRVLSTRERMAFGTLVRALPEYMILAQVPLARFLNVPKRNSYADWLRRVGYQSVDFVVCDMGAQVIAVVELQSPQMSDRARKRMARMSRVLKAAEIPMHVWREEALPSADAAREVLLPRPLATPNPSGLSPAAVTGGAVAGTAIVAGTAVATAPPKTNPFDEAGRDSAQDEMIELLEPPATWFDDLDSDPVPLDKR